MACEELGRRDHPLLGLSARREVRPNASRLAEGDRFALPHPSIHGPRQLLDRRPGPVPGLAHGRRDSGKFRLDDVTGEVVFNFGRHRGQPARLNDEYLEWMLGARFPPDTKAAIRVLRRNGFRWPAPAAPPVAPSPGVRRRTSAQDSSSGTGTGEGSVSRPMRSPVSLTAVPSGR